jgi:hypothetical protein
MKIVYKSYDLGKFMYQLTPLGLTCLLALHLLGLGFWMPRFFLLLIDAKKAYRPHCNVLMRMHVATTSLLRDQLPPFEQVVSFCIFTVSTYFFIE